MLGHYRFFLQHKSTFQVSSTKKILKLVFSKKIIVWKKLGSESGKSLMQKFRFVDFPNFGRK